MKHNGWFVNPYNAWQAVNLKQAVGLQLAGNSIIIFTHTEQITWHFPKDIMAQDTYESMVRVAQE